jgi:nucleoside-diphosphate-sugar epimerase
MRVLITGESGFIAKNLKVAFESLGHDCLMIDNANVKRLKKTGEVCVYRNTAEEWAWHLENLKIDVVVHNAAAVGTDVVALSPQESVLTNVTGTYNLVRACNLSKIPICYMGTTVIYDTAKYQSSNIVENSDLNPTTLYGISKLSSEQIIKTHSRDWMILRPLFAYGGVGDMNSLISKTIFAAHQGRNNIDMFLDPQKIKDYLHVSDYCNAVVLGCTSSQAWGQDFNIAAETPVKVLDIVNILEKEIKADLSKILQWHPSTDYLGNHRLSSSKFRLSTGWEPCYTLEEGIKKSVQEIQNDDSCFNPLAFLDEAKNRDVDLTEFFNSNI